MKQHLDELDRAIVEHLMLDGRMSAADIARDVKGVSDRTVSSRIDRLIQRGVMRIVPRVYPEFLGYSISADLSIQTESKLLVQVAEALVELEEVSYVAIIAGDRDITITVHVANVLELQHFLTEKVLGIPGVERSRTQIITQILKDDDRWGIPQEAPVMKGESE